MSIKAKAKQNPAVALAISLVAIAGMATAGWQGVVLVDTLHLTEAEAAVIHDEYDEKFTALGETITAQALVSECRWLQDKLDRLRYEIYVLERDKANGDFIQEKKSQLIPVQEKFNLLACAAKV